MVRNILLIHALFAATVPLCLDLLSGKVEWERLVHRDPPPAPIHIKSSYATETPVTDSGRLLIRRSARIYCIEGPRCREGSEKGNRHDKSQDLTPPLLRQCQCGSRSSSRDHFDGLGRAA